MNPKKDETRGQDLSKVDENTLRRTAKRQGYDLSKSRSRDPMGVHFGMYQLTNIEDGAVYLDATTGGVWLTPASTARALGREDMMTNGGTDHVADAADGPQPTPTIPVVALKLVPQPGPPDDDSWEVEAVEGGIIATLALCEKKARELAEKILSILDGRGEEAVEA